MPQFSIPALNRVGHCASVQHTASKFLTMLTTNIKIIGLKLSGKPFTVFANRTAAMLLKPTPGGAVSVINIAVFANNLQDQKQKSTNYYRFLHRYKKDVPKSYPTHPRFPAAYSSWTTYVPASSLRWLSDMSSAALFCFLKRFPISAVLPRKTLYITLTTAL